VALANAPSKAVADQCQTVKTRKRNYRCVLTWFASRWRNHQPKRAEKPHSKVNAARRWPALLRGRNELRLPWRIASGSWQPSKDERLMSARERELGELPSPICPCLTARLGRDFLIHLPPSGRTLRRAPQSSRRLIPTFFRMSLRESRPSQSGLGRKNPCPPSLNATKLPPLSTPIKGIELWAESTIISWKLSGERR